MARIYISGPMTGIAEHNFPAFATAAVAWRAKGWDVFNPAESFDGYAGLPYKEYVAHDIAALRECDAIALLPGWDGVDARGSVWELRLAQFWAREVYDAMCPVPPPGSKPFRTTLSTDSDERKDVPLARGVLDYFPAALAAVAMLSLAGNEKHNPGQDLHWARGKSMDHADCIVRHLIERGMTDTDGLSHTVKVAWRALALLQEELEAQGAPMARGARKEDGCRM